MAGCGLLDPTIPLPNNHKLVLQSDRWAWIYDQNGNEYDQVAITAVAWDDVYIYGQCRDLESTSDQQSWFVIDSFAETFNRFASKEQMEQHLFSFYAAPDDLKTPMTLRKERFALSLILASVVGVWVIVCGYFIHKKIRSQPPHPDRL